MNPTANLGRRFAYYRRLWVSLWILGGILNRLTDPKCPGRGSLKYRHALERYEFVLESIRKVQDAPADPAEAAA